MIDPIIVYASQATLAAILWLGAIDKLWHFMAFEMTVTGYRILPASLHRMFAICFVGLEAIAGLLLLVPAWRIAGAAAALALLAVSTLGIAINLLRGNTDISCGCGGLSRFTAGLSWWIVARNGLLVGLALLIPAAAGQHARALLWLDAITFFGATLAMLGLYFILDQLIAAHMQMQKAESRP